ncbi:hypothetical protein V1278_002656 [Bradyrhizobium sp. AZCC 1577]|uniref:hypothetical protein n=1 Tax=Bradyrhizobium sp. AZCC 1577 TaxID=3117019 RepID=UPI002FF41F63
MSKVDALPARSGIEMHPAILIGLLFAAAAALTVRHLSGYLPRQRVVAGAVAS